MSDCVVAGNIPMENPNSSKGFRGTHFQRGQTSWKKPCGIIY